MNATNAYLDEAHIAQSDGDVEWHPLRPFLPEGTKVLFLGSFPPQRKRWCMNFYYPNFLNDHWRIEGAVFAGDRDRFVDAAAKCFKLNDIIVEMTRRGIGFYDTSTAIRRLADNASDKFLEVVEPTDIVALTAPLRDLRAIACTGEKATQTIAAWLGLDVLPGVGESVAVPVLSEGGRDVRLYRLPSSSRAYPLAFERKVEAYRRMFEEVLGSAEMALSASAEGR